jgi:uncharacterized protein
LDARSGIAARSRRKERALPRVQLPEGNCGTCRTRILKGLVTYSQLPSYKVRDGEALICIAVPAATDAGWVEAVHLDL